MQYPCACCSSRFRQLPILALLGAFAPQKVRSHLLRSSFSSFYCRFSYQVRSPYLRTSLSRERSARSVSLEIPYSRAHPARTLHASLCGGSFLQSCKTCCCQRLLYECLTRSHPCPQILTSVTRTQCRFRRRSLSEPTSILCFWYRPVFVWDPRHFHPCPRTAAPTSPLATGCALWPTRNAT